MAKLKLPPEDEVAALVQRRPPKRRGSTKKAAAAPAQVVLLERPEYDPIPPMPDPDSDEATFAEGMLKRLAWIGDRAAEHGSWTAAASTATRAIEVHQRLTRVRTPGRRSIWDLPAEERRARIMAGMESAPDELLEMAAEVLKQRRTG